MESLKATALGLAVRFAREELKLTSNDLAAQAGLTPSSLSRSERGIRMLAVDEAENIAKVLGLTVDRLLEQARRLEQQGVVQKHIAAVENLSRALDAGRAAALSAKAQLAQSKP